jgi:hypothetical protein
MTWTTCCAFLRVVSRLFGRSSVPSADIAFVFFNTCNAQYMGSIRLCDIFCKYWLDWTNAANPAPAGLARYSTEALW